MEVSLAPEAHWRRYRYVGPVELSDEVRPGGEAVAVGCQADLDRWLKGRGGVQDPGEPFTFVVGLDGLLRLAPRRSEHVACAGGRDVFAAGEMRFAGTAGEWSVAQVSNQSTGYCPDPDCWPAVANALERAGLPHPGDFTDKLLFRRCPGCGERNVVKDRYFFCDLCGATLPEHWNFDVLGRASECGHGDGRSVSRDL